MKRTGLIRPSLALLLTLVMAGGAQAHHSPVGEFDTPVDFELRGTITEVEWFNPHIWHYMDVVNDDGVKESWQCESSTRNITLDDGTPVFTRFGNR